MMKMANLAVRFLLELCVLASLGYWGFQTSKGLLMKIGLGMGAPLFVAAVWAVFGSPGAPVPLSAPLHLLLELAVFGLAAVALYAAGKHELAIAFGMIVVANRVLMYIWEQ
ncbi:YrdB family protein [Brevibacillus sp. H7]|jgi:hypothetical protein|uniref:YrdB family protein n=1 Tax=Brevibacillus sp. H7 TaxID=3349138 RepID=UPI0038017F6E